MTAGALRDRVRFDRREADANGDALGPWVEGFTVSADIEYLRGSELALTHRLEGRQPVSVTVRVSTQTRAIAADMRMVDVRTGTAYNVTASAPGRKAGYLNILAVSGGAEG